MQDTKGWLLEPEFHEPYQAWHASKREPADNAAFVNAINPMINKHLLRFEEQDRLALRPKAKVLALQSMNRYDPTRANLNTFFNQQLQKLNREYNSRQQIIHIPENKNYERQRIITKAKELETELGRAPTTYELSDHIHMNPAKIEKIMNLGNAITYGAFETNSEEGGHLLPAVVSPVKFNTVVNLVYPDLNSKDKLVMEHTFGLYGKRKLTPAELAKKLGVSQATISLRKKHIQQQMDKSVGLLR